MLLGLAGIGLLVWLGMAILSPTNIALHKRTIVSSNHPKSTAREGGLTDGSNGDAYGVHTAFEDNPWVRVDLGEVYQLKKIKIFNRTDCCFDACLPLTLEISENEVGFTELGHRTTSFSQWSPWVLSPKGKRARYIQVRGPKGQIRHPERARGLRQKSDRGPVAPRYRLTPRSGSYSLRINSTVAACQPSDQPLA